VSLLLANIGQLATCPPGHPQQDAGLVHDAAVLVQDGRIAWAGPAHELPATANPATVHDCGGGLVIPGLIDCHTHLCFGGWRGDEFEQRLAGASYQQIAAAGGGIRHTVRNTREATTDALLAKARLALDGMLALGVTTVEAKSGYGLDVANEIRQLEIYRELDAQHAIDLVPTFLGAHVIPDEFADKRTAWVDIICDQLLPEIARRGLARFCDAFVEQGAYTAEEGRRILARAANLGLGLKLHADQLSDGGGAALAAKLGAVSAEHLEYAHAAGMAAMAKAGTVAVSLPLASLYLRERYLPARDFMQAGVRVAVATDFNPGSAPSYHLPLAMTLACLNQQMTPQEVLTGATTIAARALALQQEVGSVLPGYRADLALLDAPDVNQWLYHFRANACMGVFKNGQLCTTMPPC
jgi:imidazolonepropionase